MKLQNYELKSMRIKQEFKKYKANNPEKFEQKLQLSWSNWMFGLEKLEDTVKRLKKNDVDYIELHGNHYGNDLGYDKSYVINILKEYDMHVSGVAALFSLEFDLASTSPVLRQNAIDYIKRELEFASAVNAEYLLIIPSSVGRITPEAENELERSCETLGKVAHLFCEYDIKGAIEPIREAEVSLIHKVSEAKKYIQLLDNPGIKHINGDIFHMLTEEKHIGEAILEAGEALINIHISDSNRDAVGEGIIDIDTIIMALYLVGMNNPGRFVTGEPIGPSADPFTAMYGYPDTQIADDLVCKTIRTFRERENVVLSLSDTI